jgi:NAD(P)-dependent dehydrogenase (short-subunit alcohol dehydrogenase family)
MEMKSMTHSDDAATNAFLKTLSPNGATGETQDVVNAILYLTDSNFTSGTVMVVDGGSTAGIW